MLLAHIRQSDFCEQSVQEHLEEVALMARTYGETAKLGAHAELAGFLHDMGKYTMAFTTYLKNAVIDDNVSSEKIDHSTAGAKYLYERFYGKDTMQNYVIETIGMAILSHHSGLQNFVQPDLKPSDYLRRVTNEELPHYNEVVENFEMIDGNSVRVKHLIDEAKDEFRMFMQRIKPFTKPIIYLTLMQKFVFSCLIDADRTKTRQFEENELHIISNYESVFETGYDRLMDKVTEWEQDTTTINQLRNEMSQNCDAFAEKTSGIYKLTIPTGGGKTIASLRYALKHAKLYRKSRIIYIVPYTTIIEQNAAAVANVIKQPEAVLEHHANIIDDTAMDSEIDYYDQKYHKQLQLGRDNWDYPIIFTTMVQFLDAFYQKGTRKARRLHHLTNAVLVFDEVQAVPHQHNNLFSSAINFLHVTGASSILLCTATQPAVDEMNPPVQMHENAEMVPNLNKVVESFKRVSIHDKVQAEGWDADEIANFAEEVMEASNSLLIILNTKAAGRKLYEKLSERDIARVVHLSTSMCPAHRKKQLANIQTRLGNERVICISTQLIEAGVDISFESVIRSLAGLDSIAQAAGRCNRNRERAFGNAYVIRAADENLSRLPEIRIGGEVTKDYILSDPQYANDLLSPDAMTTYFQYFQAQAEREISQAPAGLDYPLIELIDGNFAAKQRSKTRSKGMFKTIERYFEAIDSPTTAVIVPHGDEGKNIIAHLNEEIQDYDFFNQLMKQAQQYSVNLYDHELRKLSSDNMLMPLYHDTIYCLHEKAYNEEFGMTLEAKGTFTSYHF